MCVCVCVVQPLQPSRRLNAHFLFVPVPSLGLFARCLPEETCILLPCRRHVRVQPRASRQPGPCPRGKRGQRRRRRRRRQQAPATCVKRKEQPCRGTTNALTVPCPPLPLSPRRATGLRNLRSSRSLACVSTRTRRTAQRTVDKPFTPSLARAFCSPHRTRCLACSPAPSRPWPFPFFLPLAARC